MKKRRPNHQNGEKMNKERSGNVEARPSHLDLIIGEGSKPREPLTEWLGVIALSQDANTPFHPRTADVIIDLFAERQAVVSNHESFFRVIFGLQGNHTEEVEADLTKATEMLLSIMNLDESNIIQQHVIAPDPIGTGLLRMIQESDDSRPN